jgi:hypothetical protein
LFVTAAKILATLATKTIILICNHLDRKAKPILRTIPAAIILRRWKEVIAGLSVRKYMPLPNERSKLRNTQALATAADIGIYACTDPVQIQTPGTTCFKIMAVRAPAEWLMSLMWINSMLNMAYDFYTNEHISAVVKASYNTGDSLNTPESHEKRWSPRG